MTGLRKFVWEEMMGWRGEEGSVRRRNRDPPSLKVSSSFPGCAVHWTRAFDPDCLG